MLPFRDQGCSGWGDISLESVSWQLGGAISQWYESL